MSAIPAYQAATPGNQAQSGHINQFLATHNTVFVYQGALASSQATGAAVYSDTYTQWLAQSVTTSATQTAIGSLLLQMSAVGGSPTTQTTTPLLVTLQPDDGNGNPNGTVLASAALAEPYVYSSGFWVTVPMPASGLTPSTKYHIVTAMVGSSSHYFAWQRSNQTVGASTSPDGVTWTTQAFGLMFQCYDQTVSGQLQYIVEDSGARWTQLAYNANGSIATVTEYTAAQTPAGALQSTRSLSYTNGLLTGVA